MATKQERRALSLQLRAREKSVEAFVLKLQRLLDLNLESILERLRADNKDQRRSAQEAANVLGGLFSELRAQGYDEELKKIDQIYSGELEYVRETLGNASPKPVLFSGTTKRTIDALIDIDKRKITGALQKYAGDISAAVMRQVVVGEPPKMKDLRAAYGDRLASQLTTEINTSVSAFSRTVTQDQARELGLELFLYLGPDDDLTRPFCEETLKGNAPGVEPRDVPIYTADEIARMDNEQGLDVSVYCGGYNCRHQWSALSLEDAISRGYKPKP